MSGSRSAKARKQAREGAWADTLTSAEAPSALAKDPVTRSNRWTVRQLAVLGPLALCAAVGAHVIFTGVVWAASEWLGSEKKEELEKVIIAVTEEQPLTEEVEVEEPDQKAEPDPEPEPEAEPEPEPEPRSESKKTEPETVPEPEPPPDLPPPPKRIVGLDLGSTVAGGSGPAFATGTNLRGTTADTATDPTQAAREPETETETKADPGQAPGTNRKATRIPQAGVKLVKPKRKSRVKPDYPPKLRAQGIEGNVVIEVQLAADGTVLKASIVSPCPYPEMNEQALIAAEKEQFAPATRNGKGIPFTISYTVRFRLSES
jgi:TonB family protein